MLLYPSIFILLKGIYMEISEKRLLDVLEISREKFWKLGVLSSISKQEIDNDPELKERILEIIEKYPNDIEYVRKHKDFSNPYFWGLYVGIDFCMELINEGEDVNNHCTGRVGFPVL